MPDNLEIILDEMFESTGLLDIPISIGSTISKYSVTTVEQYPSPGSGELDESGMPLALSYPGQRPQSSFTLLGKEVDAGMLTKNYGVNFYINTKAYNNEELVFNIDDILYSLEATPMQKRYPVIAFGSNANPSQLAQKFKELEGPDKYVVPTIMANVEGVVAVYAARIGINGYVFTDLFPVDSEAESSVHVNFLSKSQLVAMDATEKAYSMCKINDVKLQTNNSEGYLTDAYLYVGREDDKGANILINENGKPIRLAEIATKGGGLDEQFTPMTQAEVQRYIFETAGSAIADSLLLPSMPDNEVGLIKLIINRKSDPRLESLRKDVKSNKPIQPLGRVVGKLIQQAISNSGITTTAGGLRKIIPKDSQDIDIHSAQTFANLRSSH